jgi:hypothetical protein
VTRASIELLLLLDKLVQGNRDALLALLKTPIARALRAVVFSLEAEQGRWLLFSFDRLHQVGCRFDTY